MWHYRDDLLSPTISCSMLFLVAYKLFLAHEKTTQHPYFEPYVFLLSPHKEKREVNRALVPLPHLHLLQHCTQAQ